VYDDDSHDGRCVKSLRFHDVPRLAVCSRLNGSLVQVIKPERRSSHPKAGSQG
jgi:hypothetical protein